MIFRIFIFQENHQYWLIIFFKKRYINSTSHEHNPKSISQLYRQYPTSFQLHLFKENRVIFCLLTLPHLLHALPLPWQRCWLSPWGSWHRSARTDLGTQRGHRKGWPWCSHGSETLLDVMGIFGMPQDKTQRLTANQKHKYVFIYIHI